MADDPLKIIEHHKEKSVERNKKLKFGGRLVGYFVVLLCLVIGYLAARGLNSNLPPLNFTYLLVGIILVSVLLVFVNVFINKNKKMSRAWMFVSPIIIAIFVMVAYKYIK